MDIVLIAGLWLDGGSWTQVAEELGRLGHRARPVTLPGQGDGNAAATLEDQRAAVLAAVDASAAGADPAAGPATLVVGHSAACTLAWLAADARPEQTAKVVLIGGFPGSDGGTYADFFPVHDGAMAFPGWEPFEGPDSADLDEAARQRLQDGAIPVPEGVARGTVKLTDARRYAVPTVVVCPEFSPEQAKGWIEAGEVAELAKAEQVSFVDIESGHWPMFTRPAELARILHEIAVG
ncbi:alpha/beta fold hydrolase [Actinospica durhamensis]|nr:alpha/beta hydrolase [Actinospica durhamensis]